MDHFYIFLGKMKNQGIRHIPCMPQFGLFLKFGAQINWCQALSKLMKFKFETWPSYTITLGELSVVIFMSNLRTIWNSFYHSLQVHFRNSTVVGFFFFFFLNKAVYECMLKLKCMSIVIPHNKCKYCQNVL